jgi:hypothetical protein
MHTRTTDHLATDFGTFPLHRRGNYCVVEIAGREVRIEVSALELELADVASRLIMRAVADGESPLSREERDILLLAKDVSRRTNEAQVACSTLLCC